MRWDYRLRYDAPSSEGGSECHECTTLRDFFTRASRATGGYLHGRIGEEPPLACATCIAIAVAVGKRIGVCKN